MRSAYREAAPSSQTPLTVKKDGLAQVHPSTRTTALYPTSDEEGLALRAARKHCMSELVRVGSNPTYAISLRSLADTLDSMLLDHEFSLSEAGRYFKEHSRALRAQLLRRQADVEDGHESLATVWDEVMWAPLVELFGQPTVSDRQDIAHVALWEGLGGKLMETNQSVIAWVHNLYMERVELLVPEMLAQVLAKAVTLANQFCTRSKSYGRRTPRYMSEFPVFLNDLQQQQVTPEAAASFFKRLRQRARAEDGGNSLLNNAFGPDSDSSSDSERPQRVSGKVKGKGKGRASHRRPQAAALLTMAESDSEHEVHFAAQAYAIDGLRSQPLGPKAVGSTTPAPVQKAAGPPGLSPQDMEFHQLMLQYPDVPLVWLKMLLASLPRDLPAQIPAGATSRVCFLGPHPPCNSCSNKCICCGWNGVHVTADCSQLRAHVDRQLNSQRTQGGNQGRGGAGGGRGGGRQGGQGGNGGRGTGGGRNTSSGGQAFPMQLATSVVDPGPSVSVAGGGAPMISMSLEQLQHLMSHRDSRAASPPRSSRDSGG